jgi:hypothetical protein
VVLFIGPSRFNTISEVGLAGEHFGAAGYRVILVLLQPEHM